MAEQTSSDEEQQANKSEDLKARNAIPYLVSLLFALKKKVTSASVEDWLKKNASKALPLPVPRCRNSRGSAGPPMDVFS